ncbi:MAG TPA: hypothetical protein VFZ09_51290 [Archangium sp.]|uniref:hypothetical protein n=1 Tax=Archangium sp. TaxID=1872627 RepID=UPI002E2F902A|nr:hypothetical protein [Archangium sp.]HEX5754673.1 hypothetical protein [Archangium sp.]
MGYIADELRITIKQLGIATEELSPAQLRFVREGLDARFIDPSGEGPLWERIRGDVSVRNPDAWQWISSVPHSGRAILFFDEQEEPAGFVFTSAADAVTVLAESTGFEFYLTDDARSFLLAFNHHDYLSAAGTAVGWLRSLMRRGAPELGS